MCSLTRGTISPRQEIGCNSAFSCSSAGGLFSMLHARTEERFSESYETVWPWPEDPYVADRNHSGEKKSSPQTCRLPRSPSVPWLYFSATAIWFLSCSPPSRPEYFFSPASPPAEAGKFFYQCPCSFLLVLIRCLTDSAGWDTKAAVSATPSWLLFFLPPPWFHPSKQAGRQLLWEAQHVFQLLLGDG